MSKFSRFMKQNKKEKENTTYAPTKSLLDEDGKPIKFVIKAITTKEDADIRDECTVEVPIIGKPNMYRPKLNTSKYIVKLLCSSIIEPDLYDSKLQDSYGVKTPEDLIQEMIDDPGEYQDFATFVSNFNGFNKNLSDKVEEAKN